MVALSTLCGLLEPSVFMRMSCTPAASRIGRTAPPAMTPVPATAGFRKTRPAPKWPVISQGIVVSLSGTKTRSFLACSTALRIASGTSWALPRPTPTWPRPSPTTTSAVKEKRRPPLTTFATRLMDTTRSFSSSTLGSILVSATYCLLSFVRAAALPPQPSLLGEASEGAVEAPSESKGEAAGARGIRQRLHPAVILVTAAIEHDALDARRLGSLGQHGADRLGGGHVAARLVLLEERLDRKSTRLNSSHSLTSRM